MIRIITKKRLELLEICEQIVKARVEDEGWDDKGPVEQWVKSSLEDTYHCGAKSCQFHTTDTGALMQHRADNHD